VINFMKKFHNFQLKKKDTIIGLKLNKKYLCKELLKFTIFKHNKRRFKKVLKGKKY
jgi:hypothetical protein